MTDHDYPYLSDCARELAGNRFVRFVKFVRPVAAIADHLPGTAVGRPLPRRRTGSPGRRRTPSMQMGGTLVEFALAASVLFSALIAIADFGQLFWTNLTLQHAVREGARYAITGNSSLATTPHAADARCQAAIAKIREQSMGMFDRVSARVQFKTVDPTKATNNVAAIGSGSCYRAGEIIVVQVDAVAPVISPFLRPLFPQGQYAFSVSTTMRNEAFE